MPVGAGITRVTFHFGFMETPDMMEALRLACRRLPELSGIDPENIRLQRSLHPDAEFLIHPECGCSTSVLEAMSAGDVDPEGVQILSTEGMIKRPALSHADEFIVATEVGMLYPLQMAAPEVEFIPANAEASCVFMKMITLPKLRDPLRDGVPEVKVPAAIADRARIPIERMVAIG